MAYSTKADLELVMEPDQLNQLSDDATGLAAVEEIITRCISDGDGIIDSYSTPRYSVPHTTVDAVVRNASTTIAHYLLALRREWPISDKLKEAKDDVISWLKDVADDKASIPSGVLATSAVSSFQNDDRIFTATTMTGFI